MSREEIQSDALKAIEDCNRCGIAVSMGVGKTLIGLQHIFQNYHDTLSVLVVAPKRSILKSWVDEAEKFNLNHLLAHIKFTTYLSLHKQSLNYDVVYLDECHNLLFTHEGWLSQFNGQIVGLTGTPPKVQSSEKGMMVNKYCPIKYSYITDDAVNDGILNDYQIVVHKLTLDERKNYMQKTRSGQFPTSELASYNYWTERLLNANSGKDIQITRVMRMKALMSFPTKERYAKKLFESIEDKVILFANTQDQADKLCTYTYHSGNKTSEVNLDKFKSGDISKLSCVLQLNEGVNIPDLKQGIIMHAYGNERKSAQRLGRLLRLNPDEKAIIHILCYTNTVDETWVIQALDQYDKNKITWIDNGQLQFTSWSRA